MRDIFANSPSVASHKYRDYTHTATYPQHLHGHQLEALLLEALDNLADQTALHAVRLDHDEGALLILRHN